MVLLTRKAAKAQQEVGDPTPSLPDQSKFILCINMLSILMVRTDDGDQALPPMKVGPPRGPKKCKVRKV